METYVVRQPIMDAGKKVVAYELLYHENESSMFQQDSGAANAIEEFLMQVDTDRFLDGKKAFITFTPNLLMKNVPRIFSEDRLVIQIEDSSIVHPLAQKIIYRYQKQGYKIALRGFEFNPRYFGILDVVDYIKLDFSNPTSSSLANIVNIGKSFQKKIIASHVDTQESFDHAMALGCEYIQGEAVAEQSVSKVHRMDHIQSNFFQLIVAVTKEEPDIDEIAKIISRDASLAFSLMKLVNSAYFALKNRAKSIHQALVILGIGQLKQWVYLLSFKQESGDVQEEMLKTSFLRASFCQELSQFVKGMPISASEAYLMGMFSTLGLMLEVPLESALSELPISEDIKNALLKKEGLCGQLYQLVLCYEKADWPGITQYARQLAMPSEILTQKYFECVESVNQTWSDLMSVGQQRDAVPAAEGAKATEPGAKT